MARIKGSSCRLCRAEGEKLFLKGPRCISDKCALTTRQYTPGMHGISSKTRRKRSNYSIQLREKQKVKRIFGLSERQFKNYFKKADRARGVTGDVLLQLLERRLDNLVFRACFARSRAEARQIVRHRFVKVNGRKVDVPSYLVKPSDSIELSGKDDRKKAFRDTYKSLEDRGVPDWLDVTPDSLLVKIKRMPTKQDIGLPIEESLIIELYSR